MFETIWKQFLNKRQLLIVYGVTSAEAPSKGKIFNKALEDGVRLKVTKEGSLYLCEHQTKFGA